MRWFWPAVFLFSCQTIEESECEELLPAYVDPPDLLNRTDRYLRPVDFRCHNFALIGDFNFSEYFTYIGYPLEDYKTLDKTHICTSLVQQYYPVLKGLDPMMIANAFLEYWESFHSDNNVCEKMVEFINNCHIFLQMRDMFSARLLEKLCLHEDGCYNVMKYYEDDLPYCVKYTAISEFKNSPAGSWHHTIVNHCKLTEMVPEAKAEKYDRTILTQKGRTKENLRDMCLYLRYRLLPAEGKEQEIPDDAAEYDTETTTETEYKNGVSIFLTLLYRIAFYLTLVKV